jgi:hypothetical protein
MVCAAMDAHVMELAPLVLPGIFEVAVSVR